MLALEWSVPVCRLHALREERHAWKVLAVGYDWEGTAGCEVLAVVWCCMFQVVGRIAQVLVLCATNSVHGSWLRGVVVGDVWVCIC
jgi:hypothetical protein